MFCVVNVFYFKLSVFFCDAQCRIPDLVLKAALTDLPNDHHQLISALDSLIGGLYKKGRLEEYSRWLSETSLMTILTVSCYNVNNCM